MEEKHFLAKDRQDALTRLLAEIRSALHGLSLERPDAYAVWQERISDEEELNRAASVLDGGLGDSDAGRRPEECAGFLRILSEERRLLRDTESIMRGHKLRMFDAFSRAYQHLRDSGVTIGSK